MADNIRDFYNDWCDYKCWPHHLHHDHTGDEDVHYRWEVMDIHRIPGWSTVQWYEMMWCDVM